MKIKKINESQYLDDINIVNEPIKNKITTKYLSTKNQKNQPITYVPNENQRAKLFPLLSVTIYTIEFISPGNSIKEKFWFRNKHTSMEKRESVSATFAMAMATMPSMRPVLLSLSNFLLPAGSA